MSAEEIKTSRDVVNEETLQSLKVSEIDAIFLNRKPLKVRYYFDDLGMEQLIMIDVDSLRPIFGSVRPPVAGHFETLDNLSAFIKERIHFDECSDYQYADCICNLLGSREVPPRSKVQVLPPSGCWREQFHHACWSCVNSWLLEYLRMIILREECERAFKLAAEEIFLRVFITDVAKKYANVIYENCSEFYLWIAQRNTLEGYLRRDIINTWE